MKRGDGREVMSTLLWLGLFVLFALIVFMVIKSLVGGLK